MATSIPLILLEAAERVGMDQVDSNGHLEPPTQTSGLADSGVRGTQHSMMAKKGSLWTLI